MCTLALFLQQSSRRPLLIAANRDELLHRPATEPIAVADDPCWIVAGIDLAAGGTWLGLNQHGLVAGILNRRTPAGPDPKLASRGALCLDVLRCADVDEARTLVASRRAAAYNPFNLLVASVAEAFVVQNRAGRMEITELPPGLHLLTNLDLNDSTCPRIAKSHRLFEAALPHLDDAEPTRLVAHLRRVLSDHSTPLDPRGDGPLQNLCVHFDQYGTRSSSIISFDAGGPSYLHAAGPPCRNEYAPIPLPSPS